MMADERPCQCAHCAAKEIEHVPARCAICGWEGECPNCGAPEHAGETRLMDWSSRKVTADIIIPDMAGRVLLIQRAGRAAGKWAIPGGYVSRAHSPAETAVKEAEEEVGITPRLDRQFYTYGSVERDPGPMNVTVVYLAHPTTDEPVPNPEEVLATRWASEAEARAMDAAGEIAFDHGLILADFFHLRTHASARGMLAR